MKQEEINNINNGSIVEKSFKGYKQTRISNTNQIKTLYFGLPLITDEKYVER